MDNLNKEKIIELLRKEYTYLQEKYHVNRIGLFGSYAKETYNNNSDVDLIVNFNKPLGLDFIELGDYLEKLFGKKVDLITEEGLKASRINNHFDKRIIYVNQV